MQDYLLAHPKSSADADEKQSSESRRQQMDEVERLADELNLLLASYQPILESEGIHDRVEALQSWADCYRKGLAAADKISKNANMWIADLCERTKLAAEEQHRLENEGGPPPTVDQEAHIEETIRAARQFSRIAPEVENILVQQDPSASTPENKE